jgi:ketosteroid isomerase-like protein
MNELPADARVRRVVEFFEGLRADDLPGLAQLYRDDAFFKDPFNEVRGVPAIQHIFAHMFRSLERPRFVIHDSVAQGDQCFLSWDFRFAQRRGQAREMVIRGASHLRFADDGRIAMHRDYWDAAEELYEKLPGLGTLMRWLKRRVNA